MIALEIIVCRTPVSELLGIDSLIYDKYIVTAFICCIKSDVKRHKTPRPPKSV